MLPTHPLIPCVPRMNAPRRSAKVAGMQTVYIGVCEKQKQHNRPFCTLNCIDTVQLNHSEHRTTAHYQIATSNADEICNTTHRETLTRGPFWRGMRRLLSTEDVHTHREMQLSDSLQCLQFTQPLRTHASTAPKATPFRHHDKSGVQSDDGHDTDDDVMCM